MSGMLLFGITDERCSESLPLTLVTGRQKLERTIGGDVLENLHELGFVFGDRPTARHDKVLPAGDCGQFFHQVFIGTESQSDGHDFDF